MLHGAGDPAGQVAERGNGAPALSDLAKCGKVAGFDGGAGTGNFPVQSGGRLTEKLPAVRPADTAPAGDEDSGSGKDAAGKRPGV